MADFVKVVLEGGEEVVFQSAESDLVKLHGGPPLIERYEAAMNSLEAMASSARRMATVFVEGAKPDEMELEVGIALSGEVGWFFAKSELEASMKLTLTWKSSSDSPNAGDGVES